MDFGRYLVHTQRLTKDEYAKVVTEQTNRSFAHSASEHRADGTRGFLIKHLFSLTEFDHIREHVFGDILMDMPIGKEVEKRAGKKLLELVQEWQEWHRDFLEPISTYSMSSKFGKNLYRQQFEKKLVAQFLVTEPVRNGQSIIANDDIVIIFEGTSGMYIGLAISAFLSSVTIHTTNNIFIREYNDNPTVGDNLTPVHFIGGEVDFDRAKHRCEHAGIHGPTAYQQLEEAMNQRPPATVVVITVSGLLPEQGPYVAGPCRGLKKNIINMCLKGHGKNKEDKEEVRELVFVTDYTKHLRGMSEYFGAAIFSQSEWQELVENYKSKISIVTSPPPVLREALQQEKFRDVRNRILKENAFPDIEREYARVAKELLNITGSTTHAGRCEHWLHEAYQFKLPRSYDPKTTVVKQSLAFAKIAKILIPFDHCMFNHERFINALNLLTSDDREKLSIETNQVGERTQLIIQGPGSVFMKIAGLQVPGSQYPELAEVKRNLVADIRAGR